MASSTQKYVVDSKYRVAVWTTDAQNKKIIVIFADGSERVFRLDETKVTTGHNAFIILVRYADNTTHVLKFYFYKRDMNDHGEWQSSRDEIIPTEVRSNDITTVSSSVAARKGINRTIS